MNRVIMYAFPEYSVNFKILRFKWDPFGADKLC